MKPSLHKNENILFFTPYIFWKHILYLIRRISNNWSLIKFITSCYLVGGRKVVSWCGNRWILRHLCWFHRTPTSSSLRACWHYFVVRGRNNNLWNDICKARQVISRGRHTKKTNCKSKTTAASQCEHAMHLPIETIRWGFFHDTMCILGFLRSHQGWGISFHSPNQKLQSYTSIVSRKHGS